MPEVGVWQIQGGGPVRLQGGGIDLEARLEDWIEADPDLVQLGLKVIARQVTISAGRIDLLALDPNGTWVIVDIKRGQVDRDTIAQLQDYAAALSELSEASLREVLAGHLERRAHDLDALLTERDAMDSLQPSQRLISMIAVGVGGAPGLERITGFLQNRFQVPIGTVLFSVFATANGESVLVREVAEEEGAVRVEDARWQTANVSQQRAMAEATGFGSVVDVLIQAATDRGLGVRPWKRSIMITPPADGRRCLYTVWTTPEEDGLRVYVEPKAFTEFFGIPENQVTETLGQDGYRVVDQVSAGRLAAGVRAIVPEPDAE